MKMRISLIQLKWNQRSLREVDKLFAKIIHDFYDLLNISL